MFDKVWREYEPNTPLFEDQSTFTEWNEGSDKMMGMKRPNGDKHGVIRYLDSGKQVHYCTFKENKRHGLYLTFCNGAPQYLRYLLYENDNKLGHITWNGSDWSKISDQNIDKLE